MFSSVSHLKGSSILAVDGELGHVKQVYFDDEAWAIRYLVVDTGPWLSGREVLISPYAVTEPPGDAKQISVSLTRRQVQHSPSVDTHLPVSRQHEAEYLRYYTFPTYWEGEQLWGMDAFPLVPAPLPTAVESEAEAAQRERGVPPEDVHLRGSTEVSGYDIQASDDSIGHVQDFLFDDTSWAIRYLVVDTRNWWPGGAKVLLATHWITSIDWADRTVHTSLTREQVRQSPPYHEAELLGRDYEQRLHDSYQRHGYWDRGD